MDQPPAEKMSRSAISPWIDLNIHFPPVTDPHPKRIFPVSKDHHSGEPAQVGVASPAKGAASRTSRRLRGATADVTPSADTPPPISTTIGAATVGPKTSDSQPAIPEKDDTSVSSALVHKRQAQAISGASAPAVKKPPGSGRSTRNINWEGYGLHDPMINGVWHCSNCGCPEQIAVGRRKGPGGKDTLCGECGKSCSLPKSYIAPPISFRFTLYPQHILSHTGRYMHRYKKNRPALYNTSADYHTSLKLEADKAKQAVAEEEQLRKEKTKVEPSTVHATASGATKKRKKDGVVLGRPRRDDVRAASIVSSSVKSVSGSRESSPANRPASEKRLANKSTHLPLSKKPRVTGPNGSPFSSKLQSLAPPDSDDEHEDGHPLQRRMSYSPDESGSPAVAPKVPPARPIPGPSSLSATTKPPPSTRRNNPEIRRRGSAKATASNGSIKASAESDDSPAEGNQHANKTPGPSETAHVKPEGVELSSQSQGRRRSIVPVPVGPAEHATEPPRPQRGRPRLVRPSISGASAKPGSKLGPPYLSGNGPVAPGRRNGPPDWMINTLAEVRVAYPQDRVELVPKARKDAAPGIGASQPAPGPAWRLKCLDCPGKVSQN